MLRAGLALGPRSALRHPKDTARGREPPRCVPSPSAEPRTSRATHWRRTRGPTREAAWRDAPSGQPWHCRRGLARRPPLRGRRGLRTVPASVRPLDGWRQRGPPPPPEEPSRTVAATGKQSDGACASAASARGQVSVPGSLARQPRPAWPQVPAGGPGPRRPSSARLLPPWLPPTDSARPGPSVRPRPGGPDPLRRHSLRQRRRAVVSDRPPARGGPRSCTAALLRRERGWTSAAGGVKPEVRRQGRWPSGRLFIPRRTAARLP